MPDLSTFLPCPERFKRKGPHELAGPCPACGGRDRFLVWPDRPRGGAYLCRQCGARGDGIQFLRDFCRLSYADACRTLGLASGEGTRGTTGRGRRPARPTGTRAAQTGTAPFVPSVPETFPPAVLPPDAWREQAGAFLAGAFFSFLSLSLSSAFMVGATFSMVTLLVERALAFLADRAGFMFLKLTTSL